jgi:hypothetical protein
MSAQGRRLGTLVLGLSALGYPLTEFVVRRWERTGRVIVVGVCGGLAIRDAVLIAQGVPGRLRPRPAQLLWLELGAAVAATLAGSISLFDGARRGYGIDGVRRTAIGLLFGLHTLRFRIYLEPDRGRR